MGVPTLYCLSHVVTYNISPVSSTFSVLPCPSDSATPTGTTKSLTPKIGTSTSIRMLFPNVLRSKPVLRTKSVRLISTETYTPSDASLTVMVKALCRAYAVISVGKTMPLRFKSNIVLPCLSLMIRLARPSMIPYSILSSVPCAMICRASIVPSALKIAEGVPLVPCIFVLSATIVNVLFSPSKWIPTDSSPVRRSRMAASIFLSPTFSCASNFFVVYACADCQSAISNVSPFFLGLTHTRRSF